jgi:hypothetical protein
MEAPSEEEPPPGSRQVGVGDSKAGLGAVVIWFLLESDHVACIALLAQ